MNPRSYFTSAPGQMRSRDEILLLVRTALLVEEFRFAQRVAFHWLAVFPGDLEIQFLQAQADIRLGQSSRALHSLEKICEVDPEWLEAQVALFEMRSLLDDSRLEDSIGILHALGQPTDLETDLPKWAKLIFQARECARELKLDRAEMAIQQAMVMRPDLALAGIAHQRILGSRGELPQTALLNLADHYFERWPDCVHCTLFMADSLMAGGESEKAVILIHKASACDIAGQVPKRIWGPDHPYRNLWPSKIQAPLDVSFPAAVSSALGLNRLAGSIQPETTPEIESLSAEAKRSAHGQDHSPPEDSVEAIDPQDAIRTPSAEQNLDRDQSEDTPRRSGADTEILRSVQTELERVATRIKHTYLAHADGRFPIYVVLSTRQGLDRQYGKPTAHLIEQKLDSLVATVCENRKLGSLMIFADDPKSTARWGLKPVPAADPWAIKLLIRDLDDVLKKRGQMIGAILIVGGTEVVPFHHLPNPVDDDDIDVPSDNPYATRDENYFIPEWPVGRIPGSAGRNPEPLVSILDEITLTHQAPASASSWMARIIEMVIRWMTQNYQTERTSFGYTAAVWRKASLSVFRPIGEARAMLASPPAHARQLPWTGMIPAKLGYYNLHGLEDAPEWFGQRALDDPADGPDYPVALRPQDLLNSGRSPTIVFSEACFGAHILDKKLEDTLALKFLKAGTQALVGSTCTAYGSITTPLIAADLLGNAFWRYLRDGYPAGEALRLAKIHMADEMHRRQGYLDGEDQKTLISFILYGDPLAQHPGTVRSAKTVWRPKKRKGTVKVVCDRAQEIDLASPVPENVVKHVKGVVEQYLPGLSGANLVYSHEVTMCDGAGHECPTSQLGSRTGETGRSNRQVITLSKKILQDQRSHPQYARLTLDSKGKLVKLAVSR